MNDHDPFHDQHWIMRIPAWLIGVLAFLAIVGLGIAIAIACGVLP